MRPDRPDAVTPPFEQFPINHPTAANLCSRLGVQPLITQATYDPQPGCVNGLCYWNVAEHIANFGGSAVYGWMLSWWPGQYVNAVFHAVWRNPSGRLIDISPDMVDRPANTPTTFLPDSNSSVELVYNLMPVTQNFLLQSAHPYAKNVVAASQQLAHADREIGEFLKAHDLRGSPASPPPIPDNLLYVAGQLGHAKQQALQQLAGAINTLRQVLGE